MNNVSVFSLALLSLLASSFVYPNSAMASGSKSVIRGNSATVNWTVSNAPSCSGTTAYPALADNVKSSWEGSVKPGSGSLTFPSITATPGSYIFTCTHRDINGNIDATDSATLVVTDCTSPQTWSGSACVSPPATPGGFSVTTGGTCGGSITLNWSASAGATGYEVSRDGGAWIAVVPNGLTWTDTGLAVGSNHSYRVRAVSGSLYSNPAGPTSANASAACVVAPGTPTGLAVAASACGNNWLNLSWNATANATGYRVERDNSGTWIDVFNVTSWSDVNLVLGSTHSYKVVAYNSVGSSPATGSVSNTVSSACSNLPPTANAGPDKAITLPTSTSAPTGTSESDSDGTVGSRVWTRNGGTGAATPTIGSANTLTPAFSNMTSAGTYVFRLTVTDNLGVTGWDEMTVTVSSASVQPDLTAGGISPTSATVNVATTFSGTVSNIGGATTGSGFTNLFQRATDSSGTGATDIGTAASATLTAGNSVSTSISYLFSSAGTYYMRLCADKDSAGGIGTIAESNEGNNCGGTWTAITVSSGGTPPPGGPSSGTFVASTGPSCSLPGQIVLTWPVWSGATSYEISDTGGPWVALTGVTTANGINTWTHSGLVPGSSHSYQIRSTNQTTKVFLTSGSSWTVPADWDSANNTIAVIGGGGGGKINTFAAVGGGGGGAYSAITNLSLTPGASVTYSVGSGGTAGSGVGGDTYFNGASLAGSSVSAKGGSGGNGGVGGAGGTTSGVGTTKFAGGTGGNGGQGSVYTGGGGGGAGGPSGVGKNGGAGTSAFGAGGAGAGGGSNNGTAGGAGSGTTGGTGGTIGGGAGGAGGAGATNGTVGSGNAWWDASHGSGGGGGGGGGDASTNTRLGGAGGSYGGGGGGGGSGSSNAGGPGLIVISYGRIDTSNTVAASSSCVPVATLRVNGASSATVYSNDSVTFSLTCTDAASYGSSDNAIGSGAYSVPQSIQTIPTIPPNPHTYNLVCYSAAGQGGTASLASTVTVTVITPTVVLAASPERVKSGGQSTISWTLTDVSSCTAKRNGGSWSPGPSAADLSTSGRSYVDTITGQTTYTFSCKDSQGADLPAKSVTVNILPVFQVF